jgi:hypothetical protein
VDSRILGFEQPSDWVVTNGSATLASSPTHNEGAASLGVSNLAYVELTSAALSSVALNDGTVSLDVSLPTVQPNPSWYGQLQLYVDCQSANIYNRYVTSQELTGLPLGAFSRLQMTLPSDVTTALATAHGDLRFKVVLNVPQTSATVLLDGLHLNAKDGNGGTGGSSGTGGGTSLSVSISLPNKMKPEAVVVAAADTLQLADRVNANQYGQTTIVNTGTGETNVGVDAKVGMLWSAGPIVLRDRAIVTGDATSTLTITLGADAGVQGQKTEHASVRPNDTINWQVALPSDNQGQIDLQPDQSLTLEPGRYGSVSVKPRSTLSLKAGTYFMDSFTVEPESHLDINESAGPVVVYVLNGFIFRGASAAQDGNLDSFLVVALGSESMAIDSAFDGTLVAPNGAIILATVSGVHRGGFWGKQVQVRPDVALQLRPYSHWDDFRSPDDAAGGQNSLIQLPNTTAGQLIREHLIVSSAIGAGAVAAYEVSLSNLRGQLEDVRTTLLGAYGSLAELEYNQRWSLVFILGELRSSTTVNDLMAIALSTPPAPPGPMEPEGTDFVGEEQAIRAQAVQGLTNLAAVGDSQAESALLSCIGTCVGMPKTYAVQGYISYGDRDARKQALRQLFGSSIEFLLNLHTGM